MFDSVMLGGGVRSGEVDDSIHKILWHYIYCSGAIFFTPSSWTATLNLLECLCNSIGAQPSNAHNPRGHVLLVVT